MTAMTPPPEPVVAGPLGGLRIVVTRPRDQAASLVDALEAQGAEAVSVPVIEITEPLDGGVGLRTALRVLRDGDWVAVTSPNGAATVADALGERPLADGVRVAVVGPGTRDRAESLGLPVDLVPADAIAEGLAAAFPAPPIAGGRVVLARAEVARETLPIHLRMMGWNVDEVVAYRTVSADIDDSGRLACAAADAVVFTSGSTVDSLVDAVGAALEGWSREQGNPRVAHLSLAAGHFDSGPAPVPITALFKASPKKKKRFGRCWCVAPMHSRQRRRSRSSRRTGPSRWPGRRGRTWNL